MEQVRRLGFLEGFGLSVAMLAPTLAMTFTTVFAVQAAGAAAPLAFLIGAAAMLVVGLCFVAFERRVRSHGSVYSYIGHTFGRRWGFVAGWMLLLYYTAVLAASIALVGASITLLFSELHLEVPHLWLLVAAAATAAAAWAAWKDVRFAVRAMLLLEGISVTIILFLALRILTHVPLSLAPLHPDRQHGWAGLGMGMVFALLAFGGFEGAAALSPETQKSQRRIPLAFVVTVLFSAGFYGLVSYAQVVGFGVQHLGDLAHSDSPLTLLAQRFLSGQAAICIQIAVAGSCMASVMGEMAAAARILQTLSAEGKHPWFARLHPKYATPTTAVIWLSILSLASVALGGYEVGAFNYAGMAVTLGALAGLLVYAWVAVAEMVEAWREKRVLWMLIGGAAVLVLLWPIESSLYPVPAFPGNLWPYLVAAWTVVGMIYARASWSRPAELAPGAEEQQTA